MKIKLKNKTMSKSWLVAFLIFELPEFFEFNEWQFIMLETKINDKPIKRAYSIATTSRQCGQHEIWIIIKKTNDFGMSKYLVEDIDTHDTIDMIWPFWHMKNHKNNPNYLLISVWSWLWPIYSIYNNIIFEDWIFNKLVNIFWERFYEHIIPEVEEKFMINKNNIKNILFLSKEENIPNWYKRWHVQDGIEEALNFLWTKDLKIFLCWLPAMVDDTISILLEKWIEKENIKFEKY